MRTTRRNVPALACLALSALLAPAPAAELPYVRKATWVDTMIATREAMAGQSGPAAQRVPLPDFGTGEFTVTAWVQTNRGGGTILAKVPETGRWCQQAKVFFVRGGKASFDIGWVGQITSRDNVADGTWHHVALVGKPGQQWIYVDGRQSATGSLSGEADRKEWVVKIGQCADGFGGDFRGQIDEVRVYRRAMSAEEVKARFEKAPPAGDAGLVAHWPFEADGADASGSGNAASKLTRCDFAPGKAGKALRLTGGGCAVVDAGAAADPVAPVWARLQGDFADEASRREMTWERQDGIWQAPWKSGDFPALAGRYAEAAHRLAMVQKELTARAGKVTDRAGLEAVREGYLRTRRHAEALEALASFDLPGLREMIRSLCRTEGPRYPAGAKHLARLDELETRGVGLADKPDALAGWAADVARLRRDALVADNPLIDFDKLVFVKRRTFQSNHYYTDYINGCRYFGGDLCLLDLRSGKVEGLCPSLKDGIFGRFDVSFDAKRIVFGWKRSLDEGFRIYEVGADGTGLRQITFPPENEAEIVRSYRVRYHHGTDDMHPCYLPDGGICFISTRCQYGILCDAPDDFTTTVLYRVDADGGNMEKLTNSSVSEASPIAMADGRILYTRWEYVDKGAVSAKCLWAVRPDGTSSVEIYGNDISLPPTLTQGRDIPGKEGLYVVLGAPHYPQNRVGTVIRLDMSRNIRTRDPMTYITPYVDIRAEGGFHHLADDGTWRRSNAGPLFAEPYPLSDKWFLVSHNPDKDFKDPTAYGLYLLDEKGRTLRIHGDPETSCWQPVPLCPRPRPPALRSARDPELASKGQAVVALTDIYHGMEGIERGTVKYLRVLEQVPRPWASRRRWGGDSYDQQHSVISKDTALGLKVQHGVVPVEDDGSAHFLVPADRNVFFQALDENYMAVQTERTYVNYRPGEIRTCIGCHETPQDAPKLPPGTARNVLALKRGPSTPAPQPGEASAGRPLHYPTDVQPVLDKHCVTCHSGEKPKGGLDLSGTMTALFSVSYENLLPERRGGKGRRGTPLVGPTIGENHPKTGNVHYLPPKSLGSHASLLVAAHSKGKVKLADPKLAERAEELAKVHRKISIPLPEMIRLTNWVDTNGQYYGSYYGRRHVQHKDHPNFRPVPTWESAIGLCPLPEDQR